MKQKLKTCLLVAFLGLASACSTYQVSNKIDLLKPTRPLLPSVNLIEPNAKDSKPIACIDEENSRYLLERDVKLQGYIQQLETIVEKCLEE